jgi:TolB-like protein/DNA-binding CsgD family transcriptional regulator
MRNGAATLLTPRQLEVLELVAKGLTNRDIGRVLGIAPATAKLHVSAVLRALEVTNRTEAAGLLHELVPGAGEGSDRAGVAPVPGFGGRPAIAVLPFDPFGGGADAQMLADGLVEDLITGLAAFRWFPVIARNSSFSYRGRAVDVVLLGRELGVRYVVEGSTRSDARSLRIHVQLIDASNGQHVWAQSYDRALSSLLTVQSEIAESIVGVLAPTLLQVEGLRALRKPAAALGTWEFFQRGMAGLHEQSPEAVRKAIGHFEAAAAAEETFAPAHAGRSVACFVDGLQSVGLTQRERGGDLPTALRHAQERFAQAVASGQRAVALDPMDAVGHLGLGLGLAARGEVAAGIATLERAVELNPSSAFTCWAFAGALMVTERWPEAQGWYERAIRLSPRDPYLHHFHGDLAVVHFRAGRDGEAVAQARRSVALQSADDPFSQRPILIAALARLGRLDEARAEMRLLEKTRPRFNLQLDHILLPDDVVSAISEGLRRAGWGPAD